MRPNSFVRTQTSRSETTCARSKRAEAPRSGKTVSQYVLWTIQVFWLEARASAPRRRIGKEGDLHVSGKGLDRGPNCVGRGVLLLDEDDDFEDCVREREGSATSSLGRTRLKRGLPSWMMTPTMEKMKNWVMKRKAEYRAVTVRSDWECVVAPWKVEIHLRFEFSCRGQMRRRKGRPTE